MTARTIENRTSREVLCGNCLPKRIGELKAEVERNGQIFSMAPALPWLGERSDKYTISITYPQRLTLASRVHVQGAGVSDRLAEIREREATANASRGWVPHGSSHTMPFDPTHPYIDRGDESGNRRA